MQNFLIILAMWCWLIAGFNFSQAMFPPHVDTTPVPHIIKQEQIYDKKAIFTAYTLSEDETDGNPNVGAGNHSLPEYIARGVRVCATRASPLHTVIFIEGFGECEVLDRTSKKYRDRIDILFPTKAEAFNFGKKEIRYRVVEEAVGEYISNN